MTIMGWREVPTDPSVLGPLAKANMPRITQVVLRANDLLTGEELERALYILRR